MVESSIACYGGLRDNLCSCLFKLKAVDERHTEPRSLQSTQLSSFLQSSLRRTNGPASVAHAKQLLVFTCFHFIHMIISFVRKPIFLFGSPCECNFPTINIRCSMAATCSKSYKWSTKKELDLTMWQDQYNYGQLFSTFPYSHHLIFRCLCTNRIGVATNIELTYFPHRWLDPEQINNEREGHTFSGPNRRYEYHD